MSRPHELRQPLDLPAPPLPRLAEADFEVLRALIHELTGIALNDARRGLLEARLARRLRATGKASCADYVAWVAAGAAPEDEVRELINCVTTNKTDFFREPHHFEFLRRTLFPELEARARAGGPKRLRMWSAACSSGEEAYTLAMGAREHFEGQGWDVQILATDIDTDVLACARTGVYPAERLANLAPEALERHFLRGKGRWSEHFKVRPELASLVQFERLNFVDRDWGLKTRFDAILCRNVVIYFDRRTQEQLFRRLHSRLGEEGYLMVGQAENLHFLGELFEALPDTIYRRRSKAGLAAAPVSRPLRRSRPAEAKAKSALVSHTLEVGGVFASDTPAAVRALLSDSVAVGLFDPQAHVGGLGLVLLPETVEGGAASQRFVARALKRLVEAVAKRGGERRRLRATLVGAKGSSASNCSAGASTLLAGEGSSTRLAREGSTPSRTAASVAKFLAQESIPIAEARWSVEGPLEVVFHTHDGAVEVRGVAEALAAEVRRAEQQYGAEIVPRTAPAPAADGPAS
jgi:chemotaxis protein methyltransferase CheR